MSASVGAGTFEWWFPLALGVSAVSGFALWWSLNDYERARYYPVIVGVPVLIFAVLGALGNTGQQLPQQIEALIPGNPFNLLIPAPAAPTGVLF
jgi:hypothetical protein